MTHRMTIVLAFALAAAGGCARKEGGASLSGMYKSMVGPSRQELVDDMLKSPDPDARRQGIERLSAQRGGRKGAYPKAYALMTGDPEPSVRAAAVRALARVGDPVWLPNLVAALKDTDDRVRWEAAVALDQVVGPEAVKPLESAALTDPKRDVRAAAAQALRHYPRADVLVTLMGCLNDPEFGVRFKAGRSLSELTGEHAGTDAELWRKALAVKTDPLAKAPKPKRPWWDWFGTTAKAKPPQAPEPPGAVVASSATTSVAPETAPKRPWWDWMGVTRKTQVAPPPPPAEPDVPDVRPTAPSATAYEPPPKPKRPWWDWFGTTKRNRPPAETDVPDVPGAVVASSATTTAAPKAAPKRPWWDWMGVTRKTQVAPPPPPAAVQSSTRPAAVPAAPAPPQRPWWDWMGVTQKR